MFKHHEITGTDVRGKGRLHFFSFGVILPFMAVGLAELHLRMSSTTLPLQADTPKEGSQPWRMSGESL